jgi:hypothetical protein
MNNTNEIKPVEFDGYRKFWFKRNKLYFGRLAGGLPRRQRLLRKHFRRAAEAESYARKVAERWQKINSLREAE